jgi:hypothetical protein
MMPSNLGVAASTRAETVQAIGIPYAQWIMEIEVNEQLTGAVIGGQLCVG